MQRPTARRLLFAVALLTVPLPFYLGELELAPLARLLFFTGLLGGLLLAEGGARTAQLAGLGLVEALLYGALLGLASAGLAHLLTRPRRAGVRTTLVLALALALVGLSLFPLYDTPLSSTRARSSLLQIFQ